MGLISKTVKLRWNSKIKKHYVDKGYIFTKMKDEFEVNVEDLTKGSIALVEVKCDCKDCKSNNPYLHPLAWCQYIKYVHSDGTYYCQKCATELFTRNKSRRNKLNNGNSFAQFLIDSFGDNALSVYWSNKNIVSPWDVNIGSDKEKVWINCPNTDYHDSYEILPNNFKTEHNCPYCIGRKTHPLDSLGKLLENKGLLYLWVDKNKMSPHEYAPRSNKEVWWKCECGKHDDYKRKISDSNNYDFRCPECVRERDESFLQEKVRTYLNELGYTVLHEHKCSIIAQNPKNKKGHLPYDNEVVELKLIIEVHGIQHYKASSWHKELAKRKNTNIEYELYYQKLKDRYKRMYAKNEGYYYLEIPYWSNDEQEQWKLLINNKINEIFDKSSREENLYG